MDYLWNVLAAGSITLEVALGSLLLAIALGLLGAWAKLSGGRPWPRRTPRSCAACRTWC